MVSNIKTHVFLSLSPRFLYFLGICDDFGSVVVMGRSKYYPESLLTQKLDSSHGLKSLCTSDLKSRNPLHSKYSLVAECDVSVPALVEIKLAPDLLR